MSLKRWSSPPKRVGPGYGQTRPGVPTSIQAFAAVGFTPSCYRGCGLLALWSTAPPLPVMWAASSCGRRMATSVLSWTAVGLRSYLLGAPRFALPLVDLSRALKLMQGSQCSSAAWTSAMLFMLLDCRRTFADFLGCPTSEQSYLESRTLMTAQPSRRRQWLFPVFAVLRWVGVCPCGFVSAFMRVLHCAPRRSRLRTVLWTTRRCHLFGRSTSYTPSTWTTSWRLLWRASWGRRRPVPSR